MSKLINFLKAWAKGEEAEIVFELEWYHVVAFLVFLLALINFIVWLWR